MAEEKLTIFNSDVLLIVQKTNRFIEELVKSQSANVSGLTPADKARLLSYTAALKDLLAWITAQPLLDLPETHPRAYELEPFPPVPEPENDDLGNVTRLFEALRTEMVNSQSARLAGTLNRHDVGRFSAIVDKIEAFVSGYIDKAEPLDFPESSPQEDPVTPGRSGT